MIPVFYLHLDSSAEDIENMNMSIPAVKELANFPQHCGVIRGSDGTKRCAMCGSFRLVCNLRAPSETPYIYVYNRGVCTSCEVTVWNCAERSSRHKWHCGLCSVRSVLMSYTSKKPRQEAFRGKPAERECRRALTRKFALASSANLPRTSRYPSITSE